MTQTVVNNLAEFLPPVGANGGDSHPWRYFLRQAAAKRFREEGLPAAHDENWRATNLGPITGTKFGRSVAGAAVDAAEIERYRQPGAAVEVVFVDGYFRPDLSRFAGALVAGAGGIAFLSLAEALRSETAEVRTYFGKIAAIETNGFSALNTACAEDGAVLRIAGEAAANGPAHVLHFTSRAAGPVMVFPRVLVAVAPRARGTLIETYAGAEGRRYCVNAVTEIAVEDGAILEHVKIQRESTLDYHVATTAARLGSAAIYRSHVINLGGMLVRNNIDVLLGGEGAEATLNGLTIGGGKQHIDNHTLLDHAAAHCPSHELYKSVLSDQSTGVFQGRILVRPGSQKTDAKQTSKALLLSIAASMKSQPQLEIYADDVKCTHGSTIGPVDEEQVFYLQARGIDAPSARQLLTYAFAAEIATRVADGRLRDIVDGLIRGALGQPPRDIEGSVMP